MGEIVKFKKELMLGLVMPIIAPMNREPTYSPICLFSSCSLVITLMSNLLINQIYQRLFGCE